MNPEIEDLVRRLEALGATEDEIIEAIKIKMAQSQSGVQPQIAQQPATPPQNNWEAISVGLNTTADSYAGGSIVKGLYDLGRAGISALTDQVPQSVAQTGEMLATAASPPTIKEYVKQRHWTDFDSFVREKEGIGFFEKNPDFEQYWNKYGEEFVKDYGKKHKYDNLGDDDLQKVQKSLEAAYPDVIERRLKTEQYVAEQKAESAYKTAGIITDLRDINSATDLFSFVGNSIGQGVGQIIPSALTGGMMSYVMEAAAVYDAQVDQIADEMNISREEVIRQGLDKPAEGAVYGMLAGSLDALSIGKMMDLSKKAIKGGLTKSAVTDFLKSATWEGVTEGAQGNLEDFGGTIGSGADFKFDAWKTANEAAAGFLAGGGMHLILGSENAGANKEVKKGLFEVEDDINKQLEDLTLDDPRLDNFLNRLATKEADELNKIMADPDLVAGLKSEDAVEAAKKTADAAIKQMEAAQAAQKVAENRVANQNLLQEFEQQPTVNPVPPSAAEVAEMRASTEARGGQLSPRIQEDPNDAGQQPLEPAFSTIPAKPQAAPTTKSTAARSPEIEPLDTNTKMLEREIKEEWLKLKTDNERYQFKKANAKKIEKVRNAAIARGMRFESNVTKVKEDGTLIEPTRKEVLNELIGQKTEYDIYDNREDNKIIVKANEPITEEQAKLLYDAPIEEIEVYTEDGGAIVILPVEGPNKRDRYNFITEKERRQFDIVKSDLIAEGLKARGLKPQTGKYIKGVNDMMYTPSGNRLYQSEFTPEGTKEEVQAEFRKQQNAFGAALGVKPEFDVETEANKKRKRAKKEKKEKSKLKITKETAQEMADFIEGLQEDDIVENEANFTLGKDMLASEEVSSKLLPEELELIKKFLEKEKKPAAAAAAKAPEKPAPTKKVSKAVEKVEEDNKAAYNKLLQNINNTAKRTTRSNRIARYDELADKAKAMGFEDLAKKAHDLWKEESDAAVDKKKKADENKSKVANRQTIAQKQETQKAVSAAKKEKADSKKILIPKGLLYDKDTKKSLPDVKADYYVAIARAKKEERRAKADELTAQLRALMIERKKIALAKKGKVVDELDASDLAAIDNQIKRGIANPTLVTKANKQIRYAAPTENQKAKGAAIVDEIPDEEDVTEYLLDMAIATGTPAEKLLAKILKEKFKLHKKVVTRVTNETDGRSATAAASFSTELGYPFISISRKYARANFSKLLNVFLHEAIHGVTTPKIWAYQAMEINKAGETVFSTKHDKLTERELVALDKLNALFIEVSKMLDEAQYKSRKEKYAVKNLSEFVTAALTNSDFQTFLGTVKVKEAKVSNFFQEFIELISELLGIKTVSALDEVIAQTEELAKNDRRQEAKAEKIKGDWVKTEINRLTATIDNLKKQGAAVAIDAAEKKIEKLQNGPQNAAVTAAIGEIIEEYKLKENEDGTTSVSAAKVKKTNEYKRAMELQKKLDWLKEHAEKFPTTAYSASQKAELSVKAQRESAANDVVSEIEAATEKTGKINEAAKQALKEFNAELGIDEELGDLESADESQDPMGYDEAGNPNFVTGLGSLEQFATMTQSPLVREFATVYKGSEFTEQVNSLIASPVRKKFITMLIKHLNSHLKRWNKKLYIVTYPTTEKSGVDGLFGRYENAFVIYLAIPHDSVEFTPKAHTTMHELIHGHMELLASALYSVDNEFAKKVQKLHAEVRERVRQELFAYARQGYDVSPSRLMVTLLQYEKERLVASNKNLSNEEIAEQLQKTSDAIKYFLNPANEEVHAKLSDDFKKEVNLFPKLAQEFAAQRDALLTALLNYRFYGISNTAEFLAEAMSNPNFTAVLANIPTEQRQATNKESTSMLKALMMHLVDSLKEMYSKAGDAFKQIFKKQEFYSALDELVNIVSYYDDLHELEAPEYGVAPFEYAFESTEQLMNEQGMTKEQAESTLEWKWMAEWRQWYPGLKDDFDEVGEKLAEIESKQATTIAPEVLAALEAQREELVNQIAAQLSAKGLDQGQIDEMIAAVELNAATKKLAKLENSVKRAIIPPLWQAKVLPPVAPKPKLPRLNRKLITKIANTLTPILAVKTENDIREYINRINKNLPQNKQLGDRYVIAIKKRIDLLRAERIRLEATQKGIIDDLRKTHQYEISSKMVMDVEDFANVNIRLLTRGQLKAYMRGLVEFHEGRLVNKDSYNVVLRVKADKIIKLIVPLAKDINVDPSWLLKTMTNPATFISAVSKYNKEISQKLLYGIYGGTMRALTNATLHAHDLYKELSNIAEKHRIDKATMSRIGMVGAIFSTKNSSDNHGWLDEVQTQAKAVRESTENKIEALDTGVYKGSMRRKDMLVELEIAKELEERVLAGETNPEALLGKKGAIEFYRHFQAFAEKYSADYARNASMVWGNKSYAERFNYFPTSAQGRVDTGDFSSDPIILTGAENLYDALDKGGDVAGVYGKQSGNQFARVNAKGYFYEYNGLMIAKKWGTSTQFDLYASSELKTINLVLKSQEVKKAFKAQLTTTFASQLKQIAGAGRKFFLPGTESWFWKRVEKVRSHLYTAALATSGQILSQSISGVAAAYTISVMNNNPIKAQKMFLRAVNATAQSTMGGKANKVRIFMEKNGLGIQLRDVLFEKYLDPENYGKYNPGLGAKFQNATEFALRQGDRLGARLVWWAAYFNAGGTFENPTKEAILEAERQVGIMQNMSDINFSAMAFRYDTPWKKILMGTFYAFKSFAVNAALNIYYSTRYSVSEPEARTVLVAQLGSVAAYQAAMTLVVSSSYKAIGKAFAENAWEDEGDDEEDEEKTFNKGQEILAKSLWDIMFGMMAPAGVDHVARYGFNTFVAPKLAEDKIEPWEEFDQYKNSPIYSVPTDGTTVSALGKIMQRSFGPGTIEPIEMPLEGMRLLKEQMEADEFFTEVEKIEKNELESNILLWDVFGTVLAASPIVPMRGDIKRIIDQINSARKARFRAKMEKYRGAGGTIGGDSADGVDAAAESSAAEWTDRDFDN